MFTYIGTHVDILCYLLCSRFYKFLEYASYCLFLYEQDIKAWELKKKLIYNASDAYDDVHKVIMRMISHETDIKDEISPDSHDAKFAREMGEFSSESERITQELLINLGKRREHLYALEYSSFYPNREPSDIYRTFKKFQARKNYYRMRAKIANSVIGVRVRKQVLPN